MKSRIVVPNQLDVIIEDVYEEPGGNQNSEVI
jgi:hypothetical protein